jgi:CRISPR-associated endonuclease/helicase Cas3
MLGGVNQSEEYFQAANGRVEWLLWGKAQPATQPVPAHPLLCHMIDVAAVAERLVRDLLPRSTAARLLAPFGEGENAVAWLAFVVALHDLGKASPAFQGKWPLAVDPLARCGFDMQVAHGAKDHATLSVRLAHDAFEGRGVGSRIAERLGRAVAAHHGTFPSDHEAWSFAPKELGRAPVWHEARVRIVQLLATGFAVGAAPAQLVAHEADWGFFSALAGLTSVADWVGSMTEFFAYVPPPSTTEEYVALARTRAGIALENVGFRSRREHSPRTFQGLFGFAPRPLQTAIASALRDAKPPVCIIVEAPMGEGKTEAALYASDVLEAGHFHDGCYIGLPTQATANQMFDRLSRFLTETKPDERINLRLLHGEAAFDARVRKLVSAVYSPGGDAGLVCEPWFLSKKRALLAPFGAGTIDQALLAVLRTKHAFVRQLGLAGKTVVLDEVHAYDTYTSTLLDRLLGWLGALGASVVLLSATLPADRRNALLRAYARRDLPLPDAVRYPRLTSVDASGLRVMPIETGRPSKSLRVAWIADDTAALVADVVALARGGANVAVLRNTVRRAQDTYRQIQSSLSGAATPETLLLHARFAMEDRGTLERRLMHRLGKDGERPSGMIVVGTQVLEQSLDVDFDAMFTDLAPVDLVLQRAGRLHRHDRPSRPACANEPILTIVAPLEDPAIVSLAEVGRVYDPYVLRKTLALLRQRETILLPENIEPLVEAVYQDCAEQPGTRLAEERDEMRAQQTADEGNARTRLWPPPTSRDDPFRDLHMPLDEDDPAVADTLRAKTRLGDEGAELVCLFGTTERAYLDRERTKLVDLTRVPGLEDVRSLAMRTVRVATRGLVQALRAVSVPEAWAQVSVLSRRRALFFGAGPIAIGSFSLDLDPELGLVITTKERTR